MNNMNFSPIRYNTLSIREKALMDALQDYEAQQKESQVIEIYRRYQNEDKDNVQRLNKYHKLRLFHEFSFQTLKRQRKNEQEILFNCMDPFVLSIDVIQFTCLFAPFKYMRCCNNTRIVEAVDRSRCVIL